MAKNKQLSFPLDPKFYTSPFDHEYDRRLEKIHFGDTGQEMREVEDSLRDAADTISSCFSWEETVEGMNFWTHACDALYSMSYELARRRGDNEPPLIGDFLDNHGCMADFDLPVLDCPDDQAEE